jgi:hypothetical protein
MRSSRQGAIPSELGWLIDELDGFSERLRTLEAPSGESLSSTVAKLQALIANIQAQLDAWVLTRYDNATVDARIATAISTTLAGNVSIGGALLVPNAYNTDITWTRRTGWWGNDGRAGYASSSRRKKTAIKPADEAGLLALLDVEPKTFRYRAEILRRTSLRINAGEDYVPAVELGLIAEELEEAGLGFFVYHDEAGTPEGIEYGMLTVALLAIARRQRDEIDEMRADIAEIREAIK